MKVYLIYDKTLSQFINKRSDDGKRIDYADRK